MSASTITAPRRVSRPVGPTRPIGVVDLHPGDHVILLGTPVGIIGVRGHRSFPGVCRLRLRTLPAGDVVETLLPAETVLTGLYLPRRLLLRCMRCGSSVPTVVDLVLGQPPQNHCAGCVPIEFSDTAAYPIQRHRPEVA